MSWLWAQCEAVAPGFTPPGTRGKQGKQLSRANMYPSVHGVVRALQRLCGHSGHHVMLQQLMQYDGLP